MSLRSVLFLSYHFPPSSASGSFRMLGFARHLPRHGWRAVVVAPPTLPWEPVDADLSGQVPEETAVYHVPYDMCKIVRKLSPYSGWLVAAARACKKAIMEERPEAVLTSGPPHQVHWLGLYLKRRYGLPWLADFRDPWYPEGRMERGHDLTAWRVGLQEAAVLKSADVVIANAPNATRTFRDAYPSLRTKFVTLTNGFDLEKFEAAASDLPSPRRTPGSPVRVVHTGAIYVGRDPRPFLDAVQFLTHDVSEGEGVSPDVRFFGPPPESGLDLGAEASTRGLGDRVSYEGQVSYGRALKEMTTADILLLMDTPGRTVGVPAKLYEYIGACRPVLALGERGGDLAQVLEQSGIPYRIVRPDDRPGIAAGLSELARVSVEDAPAVSESHRFSREAIAGRLASLLDRSAPRSVRPRNVGEAAALAER